MGKVCLTLAVLLGLVLVAGAGCQSGTYKFSFGLSESTDEDLQDTRAFQQEPLRSRRERETDRTAHDLDGDGIPDNRDTDIDGDGIPNAQDPDDDNDGIPDDEDPDDNNDGIIDGLSR